MDCIAHSHRFQVPFPAPAPEVYPALKTASLEAEILTQYLLSLGLRLELLTQLRSEGKLAPQQASQEMQLLHTQLLQTLKDLGMLVTA